MSAAPWTTMTDAEKIERLQETLTTLISWLARELGTEAALALLKRLHDGWIPGDSA
jgi:hypothetical protein